MRVAIVFYAFIAFVSTGFNAFAQRAAAKPFVVNYPPKTYNAHPQNWQVRVAPSGMVYVANGEGLLEYDGAEWRLYPIQDRLAIRSLDISPDGAVYVGARSEFGKFSPGKNGKLEYTSFVARLGDEDKKQKIKNVWKTYSTSEGVFFMANEFVARLYQDSLYTYPKPSDKEPWQNCFLAGGKLFASGAETGLYLFEGGGFKKLQAESHIKKPDLIMSVGHLGGGAYRTVSSIGAMHRFDIMGGQLSGLEVASPETSASIKGKRVYCESPLMGGRSILSTLGGGAYVLGAGGAVESVYDKRAGLMDMKAYNADYSADGKIWLSLGKGITKVDDASPWRYYDESSGLEGVVFGAHRFGGLLYIATGQTVFVQNPDGGFSALEGINAQSWEFEVFGSGAGEKLLVSTGDGVYEISGDKATQITDKVSVFTVHASRKQPGLVFLGSESGLSALVYEGGKWEQLRSGLDSLKKTVRSMGEDSEGNLWVGYDRGGVARIRTDGRATQTSVENFGSKNGLPETANSYIFPFKNEILVGAEEGLFRFDPKTSGFSTDARFPGLKKGILLFSHNEKTGEIWAGGFNSQETSLRAYKPVGDGFVADSLFALGLPDFYRPVVFFGDSGETLLSTSEGLFVHTAGKMKEYGKVFPVRIRKIVLNGDSVAYWGGLPDAPAIKLPYDQNTLAFHFAALDFEDEKALLYSVFLEGHDEVWSEWAKPNFKEYTKLWEGNYVFKVKAKNIYGTESLVTEVSVHISAPWFRTIPAYLLYAACLAFVIFAAIRMNSRRLKAENEKLEGVIKERTAEITQQKEELEAQSENLKSANLAVTFKNTELEQQKEEMEAQSENLRQANTEILVQKEDLQKSFDNVRVLSEIGREITGTLELNTILNTVYKHVNELMDASVFGIGIYNAEDESITYELAIEKGMRYKPYTRDMKDKNQFPVWCVENKKNIFINDIHLEYSDYISEYKDTKYILEDGSVAETPRSLIYAPLLSHDVILGIITVQSFNRNSYTKHHLNILNSLSVYASTALDNAQAYQVIKKSKEHITDSIRYAKTIQFAILPSKSEMDEALGEYFVLFRPKDIVSGDFYWFAQLSAEKTGDKTMSFVAAVDCTGHGVPGAFMSMIANTLLNEIVKQKHVWNTAEILENLDNGIRLALHQEEKANDDGMDVCLVSLTRMPDGNSDISFTGAKRPLYFLAKAGGVLEELKADKRSIGGLQLKKRDFSSQKLTISPGGSIYLSTDGLMDQNDPLKQKFGTSLFMNIIETGTQKDFEDLKVVLESALDKHQQDAPQRDDITVIGIRI